MTIKQLSIFIENKGGTLIKVLDLLSKAGIQIIASTVADTKDYGIYRVLTNNPAQAYLILKDAGINVQLSEVFALSIDDQPQLTDTEVDEAFDDESRVEELRRAITLLKPDEQTLITLFYYDNRPLGDIAYILDAEPNTLATRLHRIRRKLYLLMKHGTNS